MAEPEEGRVEDASMSQLVQAQCPGCRRLLRIPAEWATQVMRCKHCGIGLKGRSPAVPVNRPTPPPPSVPNAQPAAAAPVAPLALPARGTPAVPVAIPVAPPPTVAAPVVTEPAAAFAFDGGAEESAPVQRRRRRRQGSWTGPVIFLGVLGIATIGICLAWPKLRPILFLPDSSEDRKVASTNTPRDPGTRDRDGGTTQASGKRPSASGSGNPPASKSEPDGPKGGTPFPRRALIISVHNYLYANPVHSGAQGSGGHNMINLRERLAQDTIFHIPLNQIALLSDAAAEKDARSPMRPVIENTLTSFLRSSRPQDRILVFFIGRGVEMNGEPYLVPIEGELDNAATLIPLKWFYDQLAACKARQKVFVVDISRFSPTSGQERPDDGTMTKKFSEALQKPPAGVQVWSACSAEQHSYETDDAPEGAFLDAFFDRNVTVQGKIQRPNDPFQLDSLNERVNDYLGRELRQLKLEQVAFLAGAEAPNGVAFNASEPQPTMPPLAAVPDNKENAVLVKAVLDDIGTPPIKPSAEPQEITYASLPPFDKEVLKKYDDDGDKDAPLPKAVHKARVVLWAISRHGIPKSLANEAAAARGKKGKTLEVTLNVLENGERAPVPGQENKKKEEIFNNERDVAVIMGLLNDADEELDTVSAMRKDAPKRWQANYDFMRARLQAQIAFLYEYQSALGRMRKEFPERDAKIHGGWRLAASNNLQGDAKGKKLARDSRKLLEKIAKDHKGTPWEVLAKREKLTALGLDWQPTK
jgi:hypothetical protein